MNNFSKNFEEIDLEIHGVRLPRFEVSKDYVNKSQLKGEFNNFNFLRYACLEKFESLQLEKDSPLYKKYCERIKYELDTLKELGFIDYILMVWDVVKFCEREDVPIGLGRGSAAGSIVLFLLGVTKIDPVKHELFFERFVSKVRAKKKVVDGVTYLDGALMCDVDMDICYHNRHKVIKYLEEKYHGRTSKILTLNTFTGKLCIKEAGKIVGGKTESEMNMISAMIPKVFGQVKTLEEAYDEVADFKSWCDENEDCYKVALKISNLVKNKGVHPSAISISYGNMEESYPTELTSKKDGFVSSYDMNWVSIFNVKLDILGLRAVSVVDDVCKQVGIKAHEIDFNDEIIYENLQYLRTPHGLFQIEADTNFRVCQKVKPKDLDELSAVLALARPGALAFVDQYAEYTNNGEKEVVEPFFDDILSSTGGVALYQEQLMKMAHKIGFTLDEAEILRRIVGKKKVSEVRKWKKKIKDKVAENNLAKKVGDVLWRVLEDSANYSFNKSHSISYAALAAATVYLKFKHPKEFFLSLLKMSRHEPDPISEISKIHKEMDYFGIKMLPPHLIKSKTDFSIEGNDIRFGLLSIKGISDKSLDKLMNFKGEYTNKFQIFEAANHCEIPIGILSALIQAGALEGFKQSRTKVAYEAQVWNILTQREKTLVLEKGEEFDFDLVRIITHLSQTMVKAKTAKEAKPVIKESRMETIKKKAKGYKDIYAQNRKSESFANWYYEKNLLGYTYNRTLRDCFSNTTRNLNTVRQINEMVAGTRVKFISYIGDKVVQSRSRNGNKYLMTFCSDETGTTKTMIFSKKLEICKEENGVLPKENDIVIVSGTKQDEVVFADSISIQNTKIYSKLSELKK